jgi:aryl-alcohol dehydrogenase-like predicted oxidoreductase
VQNEYSLLQRAPEIDVLAECVGPGIAFVPYFPLASGPAHRQVHAGPAPPAGTRLSGMPAERVAALDEKLAVVERLTAYAEEHGHSILELAFSWLLSHDEVASVIAGATKRAQVESNTSAGRWVLDETERAQVDALAPAPG